MTVGTHSMFFFFKKTSSSIRKMWDHTQEMTDLHFCFHSLTTITVRAQHTHTDVSVTTASSLRLNFRNLKCKVKRMLNSERQTVKRLPAFFLSFFGGALFTFYTKYCTRLSASVRDRRKGKQSLKKGGSFESCQTCSCPYLVVSYQFLAGIVRHC